MLEKIYKKLANYQKKFREMTDSKLSYWTLTPTDPKITNIYR